jgi:hypothetical protein
MWNKRKLIVGGKGERREEEGWGEVGVGNKDGVGKGL